MTNDILGLGHAVSVWAVNMIADYPHQFGWGVLTFIVAGLVNLGLRFAWGKPSTMPRVVRFAFGVTFPFASILWAILGKVGVKEPPEPAEPEKG